jgi:integrase
MEKKITKRVVDALRPGDKDVFVWDTDMTGFGLKITPAGRKVYIVQYRHAGVTKRYTIGKHGSGWTPKKAREEADSILRDARKGKDPAGRRAVERGAPTIKQLGERYISEYAEVRKKPRSIHEDKRILKKYINTALGRRRTTDITRADVQRLHQSLVERPYMANRVLALMSKMFNLAEVWGIRPDNTNPCRHVERFKEERRERFLSVDELSRLGEALVKCVESKSIPPSAALAVRLLVLTGCRLGEIIPLRWEHVDLEHGCLHLPDSKTGKKTVPLGAPAIELLSQAPRAEENPHVIIGQRKGDRLASIHKFWKVIRSAAKLEGVRLHDLRHSYASVGAAAGLGLPIIGAILGHRQVATTHRYAHLSQDPLKAAADKISSEIAAAMNGIQTADVVPLRRSGDETG